LIVHSIAEEKATPYPVLLTLFRRTTGGHRELCAARNGEALKVAEKLQGGGTRTLRRDAAEGDPKCPDALIICGRR